MPFCFCCPCCKGRGCFGIIIASLSILSIVFGIISLFLTTRVHSSELYSLIQIQQSGSNSTLAQPGQGPPPMPSDKPKQGMYYGLIGLTLSTILVGIIGIIAARARKWPITMTYGFLSLVSFLAFLISGGVILSSTIASRK